MTDLEPASALAVRIAEDCYQPVDNWDSGDSSSFDREKCAELIESDRAPVREAALREALANLQQYADSFLVEARKAELSGRYDRFSDHARERALVQACMQRLRKLLPPTTETP
jgi:hypothetical protein